MSTDSPTFTGTIIMPFKQEVTEESIANVEASMLIIADLVEQISDNIEEYNSLDDNSDDEDGSEEREEQKEEIFRAIQMDLKMLYESVNAEFGG